MRDHAPVLDQATSAACAVIRVMDDVAGEFFDYLSDNEYEKLELQLTRAIRRVLDGERYTALGMPTEAVGLDRRSSEFQAVVDSALPSEGFKLHARVVS